MCKNYTTGKNALTGQSDATKKLGHPSDAISQGLKKSKRNKRNNYKRLTTVSVHNIVALYNVR